MTPRPDVAVSLRDGLRELAELVPTDVSSDEQIAEYRAGAVSRGVTVAEIADRYQADVAEPHAYVTSFTCGIPRARAVFLHGGGLIAGDRYDGVDVLLRHSAALGVDVWTLEYPLAPEANFDTMIDAGVRAVEVAVEQGLPVVLAGQSAGGGLAAAVALECRDRGISLSGLMLVCPMLDDRTTASAAQFQGDPSWSTLSNTTAWQRALTDASAAQPGRRADTAGLPPVYLDAGSAEVFRDSIVAFASGLWAHGVSAELHIWSGGFHGFDCAVEDAVVSQEAHRARREWLRRLVDGEL